jgi:hypothetical protein
MDVRAIRSDEVDRVALALARSFEHDDLFTWLFGSRALTPLRFGFDVVCEFDLPLGGPHAWGMLRRPGAG